MVEAAGIEPVLTTLKSGTYGRSGCLSHFRLRTGPACTLLQRQREPAAVVSGHCRVSPDYQVHDRHLAPCFLGNDLAHLGR
jgi:hypothetical protein